MAHLRKASPERGGTRPRRAEGFVPHAAKVTAALSAAATTTQHLGDQPHSHGRTSPKESQAYSQLLFGRGFGGGASLREAASPGTLAQLKVAAALSAAATTTPKTGKRAHVAWARTFEGRVKPIPSHSSGEGVWGRGASLREAASPPESPHRNLFGREREGGAFSSEKAPPSHYKHFIDSLSCSSADHRRGSCRAGGK